MGKHFGPPIFAAATAITEMITAFGYKAEDDDIENLSLAIAACRELEELEMFNLSDGFVVDVWTGRVRSITKAERAGIIKSQLKAKDDEAKALKDQLKALDDQQPVAFNWRRYKAKERHKDKEGEA